MKPINLMTKKSLAIAVFGVLALSMHPDLARESRGQQAGEKAVIRVTTDEAQVGVERSTLPAEPGRVTRRAFRVVDIRPPDIGIWFDPAATDSLVIADIATTGPIAQLGFEEGDRILEVNGVKVNRETDFIKLLFATKARDGRVEVLLVRKNKEMVVVVEPALLMEHYVVVRQDPLEQLGLVIDDRYDDRVVVWRVLPRSPAFYAGFRPGDVITRFGESRIVERKAFGELIQTVKPGVTVVEVDRAKRVRPLRIEVPADFVGVYDQPPAVNGEVRKRVTIEADRAPPPPPPPATLPRENR